MVKSIPTASTELSSALNIFYSWFRAKSIGICWDAIIIPTDDDKESISSTFYERVFRMKFSSQKWQSCVLGSKLTQGVNFTNPLAQSTMRTGVNFTNILLKAFTCADPKNAVRTDNLTVFFCIFGISLHKSCV